MKCDNVCASKTGKEGENNKREIETATRKRKRKNENARENEHGEKIGEFGSRGFTE